MRCGTKALRQFYDDQHSGRTEVDPRRRLAHLSAADVEAYEHPAGKLQYEAADVYPDRDAAELAALEMVLEEQRERAARAAHRVH